MTPNRKREMIANICDGRPADAPPVEGTEEDFNFLLQYQMRQSLITGLIWQLNTKLDEARDLAKLLDKATLGLGVRKI